MNINPVKAFSDNYIWVIDNELMELLSILVSQRAF